jgi:hypothetical protein
MMVYFYIYLYQTRYISYNFVFFICPKTEKIGRFHKKVLTAAVGNESNDERNLFCCFHMSIVLCKSCTFFNQKDSQRLLNNI